MRARSLVIIFWSSDEVELSFASQDVHLPSEYSCLPIACRRLNIFILYLYETYTRFRCNTTTCSTYMNHNCLPLLNILKTSEYANDKQHYTKEYIQPFLHYYYYPFSWFPCVFLRWLSMSQCHLKYLLTNLYSYVYFISIIINIISINRTNHY
jgi:hypothetical protein